jgi:osmoprotectant transport system permease protein
MEANSMAYLLNHPAEMLRLLLEHLQMTLLTLGIAIAISVPIAVLMQRFSWLRVPIMGLLGIFYTIPSLALIIFWVPVLGLNATSVIAAMVLYTQVILVRNLNTGLESINPAVLEAARGMGMNLWQRWWQVQVPLTLPVFVAGVRISTVVTVAIATIGAKFNAGGLGTLLFEGIQTNRYDKIWAGTIVVSLLAFALNMLLLWLEKRASPAG